MSVFLRNIDAGFEEEGGERDSRDPRDKAENVEDGEEEEDDAAGPVVAGEHVDGCCETEEDVQDTGDPDKLLCENPREPHIGVAYDNGNREYEGEEDEGVGCEAEVIVAVVNTAAVEGFGAHFTKMVSLKYWNKGFNRYVDY